MKCRNYVKKTFTFRIRGRQKGGKCGGAEEEGGSENVPRECFCLWLCAENGKIPKEKGQLQTEECSENSGEGEQYVCYN